MTQADEQDRSQFRTYKARQEWAEPKPPYDASKDPAVQAELQSIAADCRDDGWYEQFFKDKGRSSSIFVVEAKDEVKEGVE